MNYYYDRTWRRVWYALSFLCGTIWNEACIGKVPKSYEQTVLWNTVDIFVFSATELEHTDYVRFLIGRFSKYKLLIRAPKLRLGKQAVHLFGFWISGNGIKNILRKFAKPKTSKQLQIFLEAASYYRHFIQDFLI